MKNILFKFLFVLTISFIGTSSIFSQSTPISSSYNIDGYWGKWETSYSNDIYGNYSSFVIHRDYAHPSNFIFKFTINGIHNPTKKEIKLRYKKNIWWEYRGTVEYYVNEEYPTIKDVFKTFGGPFISLDNERPGIPVVKRTAQAIIKIAPYKKRPKVYNFFFDNVAYGINLGNSYFEQ